MRHEDGGWLQCEKMLEANCLTPSGLCSHLLIGHLSTEAQPAAEPERLAHRLCGCVHVHLLHIPNLQTTITTPAVCALRFAAAHPVNMVVQVTGVTSQTLCNLYTLVTDVHALQRLKLNSAHHG